MEFLENLRPLRDPRVMKGTSAEAHEFGMSHWPPIASSGISGRLETLSGSGWARCLSPVKGTDRVLVWSHQV